MKKGFVLIIFLILIIQIGCIQKISEKEAEVQKELLSENKTKPEILIEKEKSKEQPEEVPKEDLVPITFSVDGSDADQIEILFPVFWAEYRMPSIAMEKKEGFFEAIVKLPKHGLIRYQYFWPGKTWEYREQFRADEEVNRMVHVTEPMVITDKIYYFGAKEIERPIRLFGKVVDKNTIEPVVDAVIVADGIITFPTGDGSYELNIRAGKHQIIVYLLDGSYKTQSTILQIDQDKELNFELEKAKPAKVKIKISANPPEYHKVRIYTSAEQTGMRFLYLNRFLTEDFKIIDKEIELELYEEQYVDYFYSVGNPYISFENKRGEHVIRNFVAKDGLVISDELGSFLHDNSRTLTVKVPEYTDPNDVIGIKNIHPTLLMMHPKGNNEWVLSLGGHVNPNSEYRYYKSFVGHGDEKMKKRTFGSDLDIVDSWKFHTKEIQLASVSVPEIKNSFDIFIYPLDFYSPGMVMLMESLINRIADKGFHGIVFSQIWGYEKLEQKPKLSRYKPLTLYISSYELNRVSKLAHDKGLKVSLFPQLVGAESLLGEDNQKTFDEKWWDTWLKEMENFNMYNAKTSETAGIEFLMFQGRQPGMNLPENYKKKYNERQKEIMANMRKVFRGKIIASADLEDGIDYWISADIVSQKIWDSLVNKKDASQEELNVAVERLLDERYKQIYLNSGKPFLIDQLAYGSVDGSAADVRIPESEGVHTDENLKYPLDTEEQRMVHSAFYKAINERNWIIGVNLFGYGFTDTPTDRDVGPRAKPAEDIASSWASEISK